MPEGQVNSLVGALVGGGFSWRLSSSLSLSVGFAILSKDQDAQSLLQGAQYHEDSFVYSRGGKFI